ncbi:MAG: biotin/lipoyl-binding protein, partial [Eubacteriales bacterium]|nr:biotin/lipoyl-binding protein [Eubacteriales bacterium]
MKNRLLKLKKRTIVMLIMAMLVIAGGMWYTLGKTDVKPYEYAVASKGNVVQEVSVTGRVVPAEEVALAFEQGGRIQGVSVSVGDKVERGDVLLSLSADDTRAQLAQAQATVAAEEAKLAELKNGARREELSIYEAKVASAETALYEAQKGVADNVRDAYTKSDDAIHNKADQLFNDPRTRNAKLDVFVNDDQLRIDVEKQRVIIEGFLDEWRTSSDRLLPSSDLESSVSDAKTKLTTIRTFLDDMAYITTILTPSTDLSATTITGWKTDITTGRTSVNTAVSLVSAAEEKWRAALSALDVAEADLAYKRSGSPEEQIAAQKARVDQMKANVSMYLAEL